MATARSAEGAASRDADAPEYARRRPEATLLYRLVEQHYPAFEVRLAAEGRALPRYVAREFEDFLACGRLEHGFLRVACDGCRAERLVAFSCKRRGFCPSCGARRMAESAAHLVDEVFPERPVRQWVLSVPHPLRFLFANDPEIMGAALGVIHRCLSAHLIGRAGRSKRDAQTGAVTLIQRFGGALNLNVHFHMLLLDGVYVERADGSLRFRRVGAPTTAELEALTRTLARRIGRLLERRGVLERDAENAWLAGDEDAEPGAIDTLRAASITYRIALGPHRGRKAFTVRTLPPAHDESFGDEARTETGGFSLHAGVCAGATERRKLERLCRYISRPALSEKRLSLTANGHVRYRFKTPWRDGTTEVVLDPLDFLARLAALVPKPRVNLTRFHGVFAPNSRLRTRVTPARQGCGAPDGSSAERDEAPNASTLLASSRWARRLRRVFGIDIESCAACGGRLRLLACIEDRRTIDTILAHLARKTGVLERPASSGRAPPGRAPPPTIPAHRIG